MSNQTWVTGVIEYKDVLLPLDTEVLHHNIVISDPEDADHTFNVQLMTGQSAGGFIGPANTYPYTVLSDRSIFQAQGLWGTDYPPARFLPGKTYNVTVTTMVRDPMNQYNYEGIVLEGAPVLTSSFTVPETLTAPVNLKVVRMPGTIEFMFDNVTNASD